MLSGLIFFILRAKTTDFVVAAKERVIPISLQNDAV